MGLLGPCRKNDTADASKNQAGERAYSHIENTENSTNRVTRTMRTISAYGEAQKSANERADDRKRKPQHIAASVDSRVGQLHVFELTARKVDLLTLQAGRTHLRAPAVEQLQT